MGVVLAGGVFGGLVMPCRLLKEDTFYTTRMELEILLCFLPVRF